LTKNNIQAYVLSVLAGTGDGKKPVTKADLEEDDEATAEGNDGVR